MELEIIKKEDQITRDISKSYRVRNIITKDKNISIAVSEAEKHQETTQNIESDRIYYIFEGKLTVLANNKELTAYAGDTIQIPKRTRYKFKGTFKAILINTPAFDQKYEKIERLI